MIDLPALQAELLKLEVRGNALSQRPYNHSHAFVLIDHDSVDINVSLTYLADVKVTAATIEEALAGAHAALDERDPALLAKTLGVSP